MQQRSPNLPNREVEREGVEQGPDVVRAEAEQVLGGAEQPHDVLMSDGDALRLSGRARGVDDVGGVVRIEREGRCGRGMRRDCGRIGVEPHDVGAMRGQPIEQHRLGDQHRRAGILQHEGEPLGRVAGIERQIGAARLEDAEEPDEHRGRALDAQPHHDLGTDAEPAQVMRQLIGAPVELAIGEAHILVHHRDGVRRPGRLRGEQLRQGGGHSRTGGVVPRVQDGDALLGGEDVEASDRTLGSPQPQPPAGGRTVPSAPRRWRDRTGRWRIPPPRRSPQGRRPRCALRPRSPTGRTSRSTSPPARSGSSVHRARASPRRCSATPASPGTADAATATAPG